MTIAQAFNEIAVAQGGTASTSGTIAGAIDALNDALAGSDQQAAQTIEDAVRLLGQNIGGGSSVTVESLTATENKTYTAPEGKAYSPVTVNVSGGATEYNVYTYQDEEEPITSIVYAAQYNSVTMKWSKAEETPIDTASAGSMLFIDVSDKSSIDSIAYKLSDEVIAVIYPTDQNTADSSYTFFMPAGDVFVFLNPSEE